MDNIVFRRAKTYSLGFFALFSLTHCSSAYAQEASWQAEQRKAISVQDTNEDDAAKLYRSAIKIAADANAPVEQQLGLIFGCGSLLNRYYHASEAKELFEQGIQLAHANRLNNWEAKFLQMSSENAHLLFHLGLASSNDPAPALNALKLRPGKPGSPTDFHAACLQAIGEAYLDRGEYAEAEKYLFDAVSETERMPDEDTRFNKVIRDFDQMLIRQKKYADATRLLVESCDSSPINSIANKSAYFTELSAVDPETGPIEAEVKRLVEKKDFAGLDAFADKLNSPGSPTILGGKALDWYFLQLELDSSNSEFEWKDRLDFLSRWVEQVPNSDTAKVAYGAALSIYAWKARTSHWAQDVTQEGWKLFNERLNKAEKVLSQVKQKSPQWYSYSLRVGLGQGWNRNRYNDVFDECRQRFPDYVTVILRKAYWLQPKWFGAEGEANKFIDGECEKLPGLAGDVLYARVVWGLDFSSFNVIKEDELDWSKAKRGFAELIKKCPDSLRARGEFAFLAQRANDKDAELSAFPEQGKIDSRIKLNPREYGEILTAAKQQQKDDKREAAIESFSKAIALVPQNGEPYFHRAEMYLMTNKFKEASADINKCLEMFPEWTPALAERGRLELLLEQYPESIADLERVLAVKPAFGPAISTLGLSYDGMGDHQHAINVANYDVEQTALREPRYLYFAYQDRGLVWVNAHQYEKAASDLRNGIGLEERQSQLWAYLALADAGSGRLDQAAEDALHLMATENYRPRSARLRGEIFRAGGQWEKAIADYDKSITGEPTYGPGHWQRAVCELALGRYELAEKDLRKSVELVPTSALAYSYLALAEDLLGKTEDSKKAIAKAFELTPKLAINYANRARIQFHHGDLKAAAADCHAALISDSLSGDAYAIAAQVLARAGKAQDAAKFSAAAKKQWWRDWQVPLPAPKTNSIADISIKLPELKDLQPQPFVSNVRDFAP